MTATNSRIVIGIVGVIVISLLLSFFGFREGEFEFYKWMLISFNVSSGPLGRAVLAFGGESYSSAVIWGLVALILICLFQRALTRASWTYLITSVLIWPIIGFFSVIAASM